MTPTTSTASPHPDASRGPATPGRPRPVDTSIIGPVDGMNKRHPEGSYFRLVLTHDDDTKCHQFLLSRGEAEMLHADLGALLARTSPPPGPAGADGAAAGGGAK